MDVVGVRVKIVTLYDSTECKRVIDIAKGPIRRVHTFIITIITINIVNR